MYSRFISLIFGALLCAIPISTDAQVFSIDLDSVEVQTNQIVCLAARCEGFVDLVSFQVSITWNASVLQYVLVKNIDLPGWSVSDFTNYDGQTLLISWSNPSGGCFSKPDGDTLFELCFLAIGPPGSSALVKVGSAGFPPTNGGAEAYNCLSQNLWSPTLSPDTSLVEIIGLSSTSALSDDSGNNFVLTPNPVKNNAPVRYLAKNPGTALLSVADLNGRTVYQEKVFVLAGDYHFDIPAEAIKAKGMYLVSLQTEQGVSTQMLSVQ